MFQKGSCSLLLKQSTMPGISCSLDRRSEELPWEASWPQICEPLHRYVMHVLDSSGHHALTCKRGPLVTARHKAVTDCLVQYGRRALLSPPRRAALDWTIVKQDRPTSFSLDGRSVVLMWENRRVLLVSLRPGLGWVELEAGMICLLELSWLTDQQMWLN